MLEESEARTRILENVIPGPVIWLPLPLAGNLALAQEVHGGLDSPEFDNSAMDGYAVRSGEAKNGATLVVERETQPAGIDRRLELRSGAAIRIFTGAPLPSGADAVVMQEDTRREGDLLTILEGVEPGENVRRRGGDVCAGQLLMAPGTPLTPPRLALLASQGMEEAPVRTRPMVHVVTTGDELVEPGGYRMPGQIYDSNGVLLQTAVQKEGAIAERIHLDDEPALMRDAFAVLCEVSDFLVITGGVSVGERDFVKEALDDLGVQTNFWRVRLKPGKPFLFGVHPDGCLVFALPGNPVSAFVTFHLFVLPALRKRIGFLPENDGRDRVLLGRADEPMRNPGDRPHYLRGIVRGSQVELSGTQQSHAIFGLSKANCLIRLEPEESIAPGEEVWGRHL